MEFLRVINDDPRVNTVFHAAFGVVAVAVLATALALCADVYGGGPGFVAVTQGLVLCGFAVYLLYTGAKRASRGRASFAVSVVITVAALRQAVMWGGLTGDTFQDRVRVLAFEIINATEHSCLAPCPTLNATAILEEVASTPHELGAEAMMCVLQALLFLLWLPYTIAQNVSDGGAPPTRRRGRSSSSTPTTVDGHRRDSDSNGDDESRGGVGGRRRSKGSAHEMSSAAATVTLLDDVSSAAEEPGAAAD